MNNDTNGNDGAVRGRGGGCYNQSLFDIQSSGSPSGPLSFDEDLIASPHYLSETTSSAKSSCSDLSAINNLVSEGKRKSGLMNMTANDIGNYEIIWRDEKIRLLENERNLNLMRIEDFSKQVIHLKEEIKKLNNLNQLMSGDSVRVSQLIHEKSSIQEYAEQLRLQKNGIQDQLNMYKQGVVQGELDRRNNQLMNLEIKSSEMREELQHVKHELTKNHNENDRLKSELNTLKINFEHKRAECEELTIMQDELLRAIAEEKKTIFEFQKLQFNENLGKEKLKKENEKLELLVDQLRSENKKFQEEMLNQSQQFALKTEEQEKSFKKEISNLTSIVDRLESEFREKENYYQSQHLNSQELLNSLNSQLREQQDKYENTLSHKDNANEQEKQTLIEKSNRYKKELQKSVEMIRILKEANTNLESNFLKNSQIVNSLEQALNQLRNEKAELSENLEILKVKLPKILHLSSDFQ
ncbi:predicted protein [Naegleria gruberi]|uniref:Predicted protein n=1 Tax=Naegleria gruberi TaxID=5762 RepID=D2VCW9_NAEGR|nr:uncharacterized protein NAEGRDRAFT_66719 [Naegleria gruberi]EFC45495.1 predicted protein [Naegleria gruberi]|eukprot:XP_002678239.1 predicted protein [Naegleria gruberi strain NEG-M]